MIITITLIISVLVAINFILLIFSCNKHKKKIVEPKSNVLKSPNKPISSVHQAIENLKPTGT